ncbi:MAG: ferric reductase-like transmembrane domain-containing protein [Tannerella sp.]|jgi:DMSO/TMAO reductase YedYZ heme-binding membrane subunit|nr:ferric reductase-like transmembrane domain-containing protein [Tannerella sp.]
MIKVLIDLLSFLRTTFPLLFCVAVFTLLSILLAKSIKKYYYVYYTLFAIPFLMVVIPSILRMCGIETTFNFTRIPVLGEILRDYIHVAALGHPLLIIIMYMGALDASNPHVKKLMSIRKELSILSGFPILTHSWIRTLHNFPESLKYFTAHAEFIDNREVTNAWGAGITHTVLVLGIVMLVLFFILWIISFDALHKRLGGRKWKQIQKWSYVLYALLFIHAMGLQAGRMVTGSASGPRTEITSHAPAAETVSGDRDGQRRQETAAAAPAARRGENRNAQAAPRGHGGGGGGRAPSISLADIQPGQTARQWIAVSSLLLIYGSYLILRIRKARKKPARRLQ